ncbi:MAG: hypothetical protein MK202_11860 [Tenacibaculum sp.]|nr:hypothetical protein [Tenacibaculum sp.]
MPGFIRKYVIEKWWISTCIFGVSIILTVTFPFILGELTLYTFYLFIVSALLQLFFKKWIGAIFNLSIILIIFQWLFFINEMLLMFGPDTDRFADNLELPKNVVLEKPIDVLSFPIISNQEDAILDEPVSVKNLNFQLYNSFQPGLYNYDFWLKTNSNGVIYLRAFEITKNTELSSETLKSRSSIKVSDTKDSLVKFSTKNHFTIYEGDWGQPYGARFEIWFKAENNSKAEKLTEKNYIIEGWMR